MPRVDYETAVSMTRAELDELVRQAAASQPPRELTAEIDALARAMVPGDRDSVRAFLRRAVEVKGALDGWDLTRAMVGGGMHESSDDILKWIRSEFPVADGAKVLL